MNTRDINLFSYHGAYFSCQSYAMTDTVGGLVQPPTHQDTLKFSGRLTQFTGRFGVVYGGTEDCADFNDGCRNVDVHADEWHPQGQYGFTIKGGSHNITVSGKLVGHGKTVDVDLGNWSDQSNGRTGFVPSKDGKGRDRFLLLTPLQQARTLEALVQLSSEPPRK